MIRFHPSAAVIAGFLCTASPLAAAPARAEPRPMQTQAQAQAEIWAKEQAIYKARGQGNLKPYIDNVASDYLAWPPFSATPTGVGDLSRAQPQMAIDNKEQLAMEFTGFAMNGDAAIIYYKTHRTRLPNGTPANEHFEVTHSWVRQNDQWKVYGGMARETPERPAR